MSVMTLAESIEITGKDVLAWLDREAAVPVISQGACQGDVSCFRRDDVPAAVTPMSHTVMVVRSEASSNTHTLHPNGECFWDYRESTSASQLVVGVLTVPEGSEALLSHQEHGNFSIAPGTYTVGRQRELAGEWAMVAD